MVNDRLQTKQVAVCPKAADLTDCDRSNIGVMTKGFALINVAEMNLNGRNLHSGDRVSDGDARMSIGTGVNYKAVLLSDGSLDLIH